MKKMIVALLALCLLANANLEVQNNYGALAFMYVVGGRTLLRLVLYTSGIKYELRVFA